MATRLRATYEIATPMFIGDGDQKARSVRPASVKGALRFWYRALNWGRFNQPPSSPEQALANLHREEGELFGQAAETRNGQQIWGQGKFLLRVIPHDIISASAQDLNQHPDYQLGKNSFQSYLLGLGLMEYNKRDKINEYLEDRGALIRGSFTVELMMRDEGVAEQLRPALLAFGLLGGLGSRNRKGLGSVNIRELDGQPLARTRDEYLECVRDLLATHPCRGPFPPFTALSELSRISVSPVRQHTPWHLLGEMAKTMQLFRGWGYSREKEGKHYIQGLAANHSAYKEKEDDHELVYQLAENPRPPNKLPESLVFGLPRAYTLTHCGPLKKDRGEINLEPRARDPHGREDEQHTRSRRASPLFLHIRQFPDHGCVAVQSFLPATFLPPGDTISLKKKDNNSGFITKAELTLPSPPDWSVINQYLDSAVFTNWENLS